MGVEPTTSGFVGRCSTIELLRHPIEGCFILNFSQYNLYILMSVRNMGKLDVKKEAPTKK